MREIMRGKFFALYAQIELFDIESPDDYPEWVTGNETAVINPKGVVVSTLGDTLVNVIVYEGEEVADGTEYISGVIHVGSKGLQVGNVIAESYSLLPWPAGRTMVRVFADTPNGNATRVSFVLQHMDEVKDEIGQ